VECNLLSESPRTVISERALMKPRNGLTQGKRVLIVDDDIDLLLTYEDLLQAHDYQTSTAENGAQALVLLRTREVDAILCDLDMPELSGDLLYAEVGRTRPEVLNRFIFVTGNSDNPVYEEFLQRTKPTVLCKPVPIDRLLEYLGRVTGEQAKASN
jgi:DNA-binding NtrC family response regulator